nr:MAG TPA: hypothetical protein [Bacteriophage sp.]
MTFKREVSTKVSTEKAIFYWILYPLNVDNC